MAKKVIEETPVKKKKVSAPVVKKTLKNSSKAKPVEDEPKAKRRKKIEDAEDGEGEAMFDPTASFDADMDRIERQVQITSGFENNAEPMSTGLLALDLLIGGGIRPAWYTNAGGEQSCKTTTAIHVLMAAIKAKVPIKSLFDYEGSSGNSQEYIESIAKSCGVNMSTRELFGERDPKTGKWSQRPEIRYQAETIGEKFFDALHALLTTLPDKRLLGGKWWYRYDDNTANKAKYARYSDSTMPKKYGKGFYIPAPDGKLQALILTDSYPAMNPAANDDDDANNSLALQARMFSKHIPRVKGRLSTKKVAVLGINQIRAIPMARYGPTEQEPGGNALKYYSDVRVKYTSRALSGPTFGWPKGEGREETEKALSGGTDKYRYIHLKAIKNKLSRPERESWLRLWTEDEYGVAKGFDPVYDTLYFLKMTGQLSGKKRIVLNLNLHKLGSAKKTVNWMTLKKWILGSKAEMKEISTSLGYKPMNLRNFCFSQMKSGLAEELYVATQNEKAKAPDEDEDDGPGDD